MSEAKAESAVRERGRPVEPAPDNAGEGKYHFFPAFSGVYRS